MRILYKHITIEFLKIFSMTIATLVVLFLMVEMVEKVDDLMEQSVPFTTSLTYFALQVPFIISQITPIATLMSVLLCLSILNKNNELSVVKAAGIDLIRAFTPLFLIGALISLTVLLINEWINPLSVKKIHAIEASYMDDKVGGFFGSKGLWLSEGHNIINVRSIDQTNGLISGLTIFVLNTDKQLTKKITASKVKWVSEDSSWIAETAQISRIRDNNVTFNTTEDNLKITGLSAPEKILKNEKHYKELNYTELKHHINELEAMNINSQKEQTELYAKLSFPLINFIMVLIAIPFALLGTRKAAIAEGIAISTVIGFSYWVVFGLTIGLGQKGLLSPIWAAFYPSILFLTIGGFLFTYLKR